VKNNKIITAFGRKISENAVVCVGHAGSGAAPFSAWIDPLSEVATVLGVRMPGRENRGLEPLLSDVMLMADELVSALQQLECENIAFFGHSSGAIIAHESAYQVMLRGVKNLRALVVSSQPAPGSPAAMSIQVPKQFSEVTEYLRLMGGTSETILENAEFLKLITPVVVSDLSAVASYQPPPGRPPLNVPILAIKGADDLVNHDLESWQIFSQKRIQIKTVEGGHFYLAGVASILKDEFREIFRYADSKIANELMLHYREPGQCRLACGLASARPLPDSGQIARLRRRFDYCAAFILDFLPGGQDLVFRSFGVRGGGCGPGLVFLIPRPGPGGMRSGCSLDAGYARTGRRPARSPVS
jgi:surfactin synthase thioesterase subunit